MACYDHTSSRLAGACTLHADTPIIRGRIHNGAAIIQANRLIMARNTNDTQAFNGKLFPAGHAGGGRMPGQVDKYGEYTRHRQLQLHVG